MSSNVFDDLDDDDLLSIIEARSTTVTPGLQVSLEMQNSKASVSIPEIFRMSHNDVFT